MKIRGIKLSTDLSFFQFSGQVQTLLEACARQEINIHLLTYTCTRSATILSLFVYAETQNEICKLARKIVPEDVQPVAVKFVSIFPHGSKISIISRLMNSLENQSTYEMCSSISTLNLSIPAHHDCETLASLQKTFQLPDFHTPMTTKPLKKSELETIAVYKEARIKTYGFQKASGLALVVTDQSSPKLKNIPASIPFNMVVQQKNKFYLLCKQDNLKDLQTSLGGEVFHDVALIYFQGPHYAERPGIAAALFNCLFNASIKIMAAACCGQSIHLIFPATELEKALSVLNQTFDIPV